MSLFHFLLPYFEQFVQLNETIKLTRNLQARRDEYLRDSDEIYQWFIDEFEIVKTKEKNCNWVTMKEIYSAFKHSRYFQDLNKKERRKITKIKFSEEILSRKYIKKLHRDRYQPKVAGKQKSVYNVFVGEGTRKGM